MKPHWLFVVDQQLVKTTMILTVQTLAKNFHMPQCYKRSPQHSGFVAFTDCPKLSCFQGQVQHGTWKTSKWGKRKQSGQSAPQFWFLYVVWTFNLHQRFEFLPLRSYKFSSWQKRPKSEWCKTRKAWSICDLKIQHSLKSKDNDDPCWVHIVGRSSNDGI